MDNGNGAQVVELSVGSDENIIASKTFCVSDTSSRIPKPSQPHSYQPQAHGGILATDSSPIPPSESWPESLPSKSDRTTTGIADDDSSTLNTDFDLDWTPPSSPVNSEALLSDEHMDSPDVHSVKQSQTCVPSPSCISTLKSDGQDRLTLAILSTPPPLSPSLVMGPQSESPQRSAGNPRRDSITRSMRFNLEDFPPITITPVPSRNSKRVTPLKIRPYSFHGASDLHTPQWSQTPSLSPQHLVVEAPVPAAPSRVAFAFPRPSLRIGRLRDGSLYWLSLFFFFNLALTLYNKGVLIKFPYPYILTAIHAFFGSVGCYALHSRHVFVSDYNGFAYKT